MEEGEALFCDCELAVDLFELFMETLDIFTDIVESHYYYRGDILDMIQEMKRELCRGTDDVLPPPKLLRKCCLNCHPGANLTDEQRKTVQGLLDMWQDPDKLYDELWFVSDVFYNTEEDCAKMAQEMKHWMNTRQLERLQTTPSSSSPPPNPFKSLQLPRGGSEN